MFDLRTCVVTPTGQQSAMQNFITKNNLWKFDFFIQQPKKVDTAVYLEYVHQYLFFFYEPIIVIYIYDE
jgi:hypothetical protein